MVYLWWEDARSSDSACDYLAYTLRTRLGTRQSLDTDLPGSQDPTEQILVARPPDLLQAATLMVLWSLHSICIADKSCAGYGRDADMPR
jgi:hypothetical protein